MNFIVYLVEEDFKKIDQVAGVKFGMMVVVYIEILNKEAYYD